MEIRERRDVDLDALVAIATRVHKLDGYPIYLRDDDYLGFLKRPPPFAAWVAVHQREVVVHVALNETTSPLVMKHVETLEPKATPICVARLLVDPRVTTSRRRSTATRTRTKGSVDTGRYPFLDVVDTEAATPAISLYRDAGWHEVGRVRLDLVGDTIDELAFRGPPG